MFIQLKTPTSYKTRIGSTRAKQQQGHKQSEMRFMKNIVNEYQVTTNHINHCSHSISAVPV